MAPPDHVPAQGRMATRIAPLSVTAAVAAVTFLLAYDGGSFGETSRGTLSIGIWWVVILAGVTGLWPLAALNRTTLLAGGLLAAYAGLTLASVIWADSAEGAFIEFNRASLYLGVFILVALAARRSLVPRWSDGFALGITAVAGLALFSRCFPDLIVAENLHGFRLDLTRLSYPLGYWNGLAIFVALAVPLLLRLAISDAPLPLRALALAPLPVLGAVLYLTSSRGGLATAVLGVLALFALVPRTRTFEAIVVAAVGAAAGIACIITRDELVNHPGPAAAGEGHVAFPIVLAACAATALAAFLVFRFLARPLERRTARVGPRGRAAAALVVVLLVAGGIVAAHPVRAFDHFRAPPDYTLNTLPSGTENPVGAHLLSAGSSGRWQQWGSAIDEFESAPGLGRGAGSYEAWWAQHGTLNGFVTDAHSLYLESLGELGIVGFLLIVGAFLTGIVAGLRRSLAARGDERLAIAALLAGFVAYAFAAGVDWMWELTVVSVVGIALLGLLTSSATAVPAAPAQALRLRWNIAARVALGLAGLFVIAAQSFSLLTNREIQASQNAVARGDLAAAFDRADNARKIEPWASTPYEQLALVAEQAGQYGDAEQWIRKAISRDPTDWQTWFLLTRFQAENGDVRAAVSSLHRAKELNPRSKLLAKVELGR
jgi:tetratricopeptide (TPR) repeat protein